MAVNINDDETQKPNSGPQHQKWFIGCSGFHYREWKEVFYPTGLVQRKWFEYYARHFNTLELNVTFYKYPTIKSLKAWYDQAPEGFVFSAKVPRGITHYRKMEDTKRMLDDFYGLLREGLAEKLGCVLFQLPPQLAYSKNKLDTIIGQIDQGFTNVIEFRNESWWKKTVQAKLKKSNISFCGVSFPRIIYDEVVINTPVCYYRFHGVPVLFYSEYDRSFVEKTYAQIVTSNKAKTIYIYFNNTASLAALHNAKQMQEMMMR